MSATDTSDAEATVLRNDSLKNDGVVPWLELFQDTELMLQKLNECMVSPPPSSRRSGRSFHKSDNETTRTKRNSKARVTPSKQQSEGRKHDADNQRMLVVKHCCQAWSNTLKNSRGALRKVIADKFGFLIDYIVQKGGVQKCRERGVYIDIVDDDEVCAAMKELKPLKTSVEDSAEGKKESDWIWTIPEVDVQIDFPKEDKGDGIAEARIKHNSRALEVLSNRFKWLIVR